MNTTQPTLGFRQLPMLCIALLVYLLSPFGHAQVNPTAQPMLPLSSSNVPCVGATLSEMRDLRQTLDPSTQARITIKTHPCNGGLYLTNAKTNSTQIVHEGWWLQELVASYWLDKDRLRLATRFYTGAGPQAAQPFNVLFTLVRLNDSWQLLGPDLPHREFDLPEAVATQGYPEQAFRVDSAEALGALGANLQVDLDFETQRLWVIPITLSSGSIRIEEVNVALTSERYLVSWKTNSPMIGTADLNPTLIWVVAPKDHRSIAIERTPSATPCAQCTGGSQHRARVRFRP